LGLNELESVSAKAVVPVLSIAGEDKLNLFPF